MSYILDALKKSDQERKQGGVPGLNSLQEQPQLPRSTKRILFYLLSGFLLINILAIGLWRFFRTPPALPPKMSIEEVVPENSAEPDQAPQIDATIASIARIADPGNQNQSAITPEPDTPAPTQKDLAEGPEKTVTEAEQPDETESASDDNEDSLGDIQESQAPAKTTLTTFADLPPDVRSALPELTIAAHYYSNNPSTRMASINGRVMRQGQTVTNDLVLDEIIREGVIFTFRKYRFTFKVFNQ